MSIAYENDKLYIAGIDKNGNGLITTPLNLTELQNTTSEISPSLRVDYLPSDLPKGCPFSSRNEADMRVFGNSTYIMANCRAGDSIIGMNSTIYHHDGVNWTTPINLSNVPWGTSNGRSFRFIKSESGQVWLFISDSPYWYNEAYSIEIFPNNTVTWRSEKQITIDEEFTDYIPRTKKISKELTIGLSVGGGILFLVVVAILFLRYKKRKAGDAKSESNLENQPEVLPTTDVPLVVVNGKEEEREVLPATDAVAEVLPATDVVTEALPATNTVTEVLPATDTVTEVLPATDAVTEVLPTTDAPAIVVDGKEEESNRTT
ncbi:hypothetical protein BGZ76_006010 [Entomortierella beljakovae]|nr:hypothetical protein BGZ76_006010 [Entomortierella beljakovae]